ncbi:hypothetical protein Zmor_011454 [Zophobas morio]|uniref:TIL domain-containing protein n=1 Tax=Zophobas morio TaxID=2755281 RepID=A0AA38MKX6_9CUCU|nr:hypothetical protein Zmor_011454 [Zophobas morio]
MKLTFVLLSVFSYLLLFHLSSAEDPQCGKNEVIKDQGFDCQTCKNYQYVRCKGINKRQCFCKDGYVRHDDTNVCTNIPDCPK